MRRKSYIIDAKYFNLKVGITIMYKILRNRRIILSASLILLLPLLLILTVKITKLHHNENVLNYFARYYFDEKYYIDHYPEVLEQKIDPFEHYTSIGWKEGKNPNSEFDTNLYVNLSLMNYKNYELNPLAHYIYSIICLRDRITNITQLKQAEKLDNPTHYLALTAIFRDEAPYLKEWIEFYRLLGVEHFYLHNHLSKDNFLEVLTPYIDQGIVTINNVKEEPKDLKHWNKIQNAAYFSTIKETSNNTEWLIIVDTDEFLFPVHDKSLPELLQNYDKYAGLGVNWKVFGSSNVQKIGAQKLLIEELVMTGESKDLHVKTILRPRYIKEIQNPHFPEFKMGYEKVNENFEYFSGSFAPYESRQIVRINHYRSRDLEFFHARKIAREHIISKGLDENKAKAKIAKLLEIDANNSVIYDDSILKYVDELRSRVINEDVK